MRWTGMDQTPTDPDDLVEIGQLVIIAALVIWLLYAVAGRAL